MTVTDTPPRPVASKVDYPHRVLVISADMGGGHNATADALEEAVERCWPGSAIRRLDALDVMGPGVGAMFRRIYVANVETTPWLYEFFYASLWRHRWFADASKRFTGSWCGRRLARHVDRFDPDLIISTYPLGSSGLAWLHRHRGLDRPTGAWVSDFAPHPFWVYADIGTTFVMHPAAVPVALAAEPGAQVEVSALPVAARFRPRDAETRGRKRADLGLTDDRLAVLLACGSYAFGDTEAMVKTLAAASDRVTVLAVCGRDEAAKRTLDGLGLDPRSLRTFGWVDDMPALTLAADLVVTNAGGATALEAMATGTSLVAAVPIAAHGEANAALMTVAGTGTLCRDLGRLGDLVAAAAADRGRSGAMFAGPAEPPPVSLDDALRTLVAHGERNPPTRPWPMRAADAFFAHLETPSVRQEIGTVIEVDPMDAASLIAALAPKTSGLPTSRRVLVRRPLGWQIVTEVDTMAHIDEVEVPGAATPESQRDAMWAAASRLWHEPLPEGRPGWAMRVVRSPDADYSLVAIKLHHSHADGISAIGLFDRLLEPDADDPLVEHRPSTVPAQRLRPSRVITGLVSLAARGTAPRHRLNDVDQPRPQVVGIPLPWADVRRAAARLDVRPHELLVGVLADALVNTLAPAGLVETGTPLRVMVPVAMRAPRLDRISGNWTGSLTTKVPTTTMSTSDRVAAVTADLRQRATRGEAEAAAVVMTLAGLLPRRLHRWFARAAYGPRFMNTVVSYMPAWRGPRFLAGSRSHFAVPVLPLAPGIPVTVGVLVGDGVAGVSVLVDASLPIAPNAVAAAVRTSFDAVR